MLIGIDGNEANQEKRVGIGEYSFELLRQFEEFKISNVKFQIYLKEKPREDFPKENENWKYRIVKPHKLWTQIALPLDLYFHKPRPDVFFTPSHYAPRFSPVPTAISIMDLSYVRFPELFKKSDLYQLVNWTKYSVKKASVVFTISRASKNDIIEVYKLPENKVVVTYPGVKQSTRSASSGQAINNLPAGKAGQQLTIMHGDYILFVGTLQPRKNITRLVEAFSKIKPNHPDLKLVIAGKKGWQYGEILESPKKFGVSESVEFLGFVKDEEMSELYKNALCFVLPSLYEGFGLPVLEAMKYGCPVVISNVSSLPEAGGDAALYVDPQSPDDIAEKLEKVISNKELREEMKKKGREQVKKFSWEKTARETLKALEEIGNRT